MGGRGALLFFPPRPPQPASAPARPSCNQPTTQRWSACWLAVRLKHTPSEAAPVVVFWLAGRSGGCGQDFCATTRAVGHPKPVPFLCQKRLGLRLHCTHGKWASPPFLDPAPDVDTIDDEQWRRGFWNGLMSRADPLSAAWVFGRPTAAARPNRTRSTTKHAETRAVMVMILSNKKKHVVHFISRPAPSSSNSASCYRYASTARRKCTTRGRRQRVTVYPVPKKTTKKQNKKKHHDRANNHRDTHHPTLLFPRSEPILCDLVCAPRQPRELNHPPLRHRPHAQWGAPAAMVRLGGSLSSRAKCKLSPSSTSTPSSNSTRRDHLLAQVVLVLGD